MRIYSYVQTGYPTKELYSSSMFYASMSRANSLASTKEAPMKRLQGYSLVTLAYSFNAVFLVIGSMAFAQTPITSSGLNTQVSGPIAVGGQTQFNITGGTRPGGGTNLF